MSELRGRTVLVTGSASGIGRCLALEFARQGCDLALVDVDRKGLESVAREVRLLGSGGSIHEVDVCDLAQLERLKEHVHPQVLVNCAGVGAMARIEDTDTAQYRRIMDVNLFGAIDLIGLYMDELKACGGHIVNVASGLGQFSFPFFGAYSTSKFAMVGYSEALTGEMARHGVRVTCVCPGVTITPILDPSHAVGFEDGAIARFLSFISHPLISTTPEKLSKAVVAAVKKDRLLLLHTWSFKLVHALKRISPTLYLHALRGANRLADAALTGGRGSFRT